MRHLLALRLQLARLLCYFLGHRWVQELRGHHLYTGCGRCRRLKSVDQMRYTRKRENTSGDVERWRAENAPEGYSFLECNWKKRKAKIVGSGG